ncbi:isoprenyl transferase [Anaerorhabdus sp.]|uniref:isoprenyl transferase n=1 Tax=Anaerorhabdus sp. TaxID=1872524 RepID=UPI002FC5E90D
MDKIKHVAIIMDGNGRWAKRQNKMRTQGHYQGSENVRNIAIAANDDGIEVLTLFAFSTENWKRPEEEVNYLMKLPAVFFQKFLKELMEKNIRIQMIGQMEGIPKETAKLFQKAIEDTKNNTGMILCFAMNYGSQREILLAAKEFAKEVQEGKQTLDIDEKQFEQYLMTKDYPQIDCLIRTSGEYRISNFLLWQIAYSELIFVDETWPEFTPEEFNRCLEDFKKRDRRFGGIQK